MASTEMSAFERRKLYWKNIATVGKTSAKPAPKAKTANPVSQKPTSTTGNVASKNDGPRKLAVAKRATAASQTAGSKAPNTLPIGGNAGFKVPSSSTNKSSKPPVTSRPSMAQRKHKLDSLDEPPNKKFKVPLASNRRATVAAFSLAAKPRAAVLTRPRLSEVRPVAPARFVSKTRVEKTPQAAPVPQKRKRNYHHVASRIESGLKRRATQMSHKILDSPTCASAPVKPVSVVPSCLGGSDTPKPIIRRQGTFELANPSPLFEKGNTEIITSTPRLIKQGSFTISSSKKMDDPIKEALVSGPYPETPKAEGVSQNENIDQVVERRLSIQKPSARSSKRNAQKIAPETAKSEDAETEKPQQNETVKTRVARPTRASARTAKNKLPAGDDDLSQTLSNQKEIKLDVEREVEPVKKNNKEKLSNSANKQNSSSTPFGQKSTRNTIKGEVDQVNEDSMPAGHVKTPRSSFKKRMSAVVGTLQVSTGTSLANVADDRENVPPVASLAKSGRAVPKRAKSVSFQVSPDDLRVRASLPKTPRTELSLRQKLEHFMEEKGYSASRHRHLRCFGVELSELKQKSGSRLSSARKLSDNQHNSSPNLRDRRSVSRPRSILAAEPQTDREDKICGILKDMKLLLLKGHPVDQGEQWLAELEKHAQGIMETQVLFWVVKALLAEQAGHYHKALDILTQAVQQNIQPTEDLKKALEEFMERVSCMGNDNPMQGPAEAEAPHTETMLPDVLQSAGRKSTRKSRKSSNRKSSVKENFKDVFESTVTKYTMQDSSAIQSLNKLLGQGSSPKVLALLTPVRRSTRVTRSAGRRNRRSFALEELPSPLQNQVLCEPSSLS